MSGSIETNFAENIFADIHTFEQSQRLDEFRKRLGELDTRIAAIESTMGHFFIPDHASLWVYEAYETLPPESRLEGYKSLLNSAVFAKIPFFYRHRIGTDAISVIPAQDMLDAYRALLNQTGHLEGFKPCVHKDIYSKIRPADRLPALKSFLKSVAISYMHESSFAEIAIDQLKALPKELCQEGYLAILSSVQAQKLQGGYRQAFLRGLASAPLQNAQTILSVEDGRLTLLCTSGTIYRDQWAILECTGQMNPLSGRFDSALTITREHYLGSCTIKDGVFSRYDFSSIHHRSGLAGRIAYSFNQALEHAESQEIVFNPDILDALYLHLFGLERKYNSPAHGPEFSHSTIALPMVA